MDEWMGRWIDGWMDGWVGGKMIKSVKYCNEAIMNDTGLERRREGIAGL